MHTVSRGIRVGLILVGILGCSPEYDDLGAKTSAAEPPNLPDAAAFSAVLASEAGLCTTGKASVAFASADDVHGWAFNVSAGDVVRAVTSGSEALDTVVLAYGPDDGTGFFGAQPVAMDDDSGPGLLASLEFTVKASGRYAVLVTTFQGKGKGEATIEVAVNGKAGCPAVPDTCDTTVKPTCQWESEPVSCDIAMFFSVETMRASPRKACEALCAQSSDPNVMACGDGLTCGFCFSVTGMTCAGCCTLSDEPVTVEPCDDDPCTEDRCGGDTCTHEPWAWIGAACERTNEFGTCAGLFDCISGEKVCNARTPTAEVANWLDDDCDGSTDELIEDCYAPADCPPGQTCSLFAVPQQEPFSACVTPPTCATCEVDADCESAIAVLDGRCVDVAGALACVYPCETEPGCAEGFECEGEPAVCRPADGAACPCVASPERCNGRDDDCDGLTDEDFPDVGAPCDGDDADACRNGTWTCTADRAATECVNETVTDVAERCNGKDDDCDGLTDDGFLYQGLPLGASCAGVGECGVGLVVCAPDQKAATCSTNADGSDPGAMAEVCDGLDNDCDGVTDDVQTPDATSCLHVGVCSTDAVVASCVSGQWECDYSVVVGFEPDDELSCDGLDNDCDGLTDEGFPGLGKACDGDDADDCATGRWACNATRDGIECVDDSGINGKEVCDTLDNDCDGSTDEEWPMIGTACDGDDLDACKNGTWACTANTKGVTCVDEVVTDLVEVAGNGKDDDCDGFTDEAP